MKNMQTAPLLLIGCVLLSACSPEKATEIQDDVFANETLSDSVELFRQPNGWKPSYIQAGDGLNFLPAREGALFTSNYDKSSDNECPTQYENPIKFRKDRELVLNVYANLDTATPATICISEWNIDFDGYGSTGRDINIRDKNYKKGDLVCGICKDVNDAPIEDTSIVFIAE